MQRATPALSRPLLAVALVALLVLAAWLGWRAMTPATPAPRTQYTLLSGQSIDSEALRGKVTVVNFWATSCTTCMHEMPQMISTYAALKDKGLEFVAVAMSYDPPMYVVNYSESRKLPFRVALDSDGHNARAFGNVELTPTTFVIDKRGNIVKRYVGEPDWAAFRALLEKSLAETA